MATEIIVFRHGEGTHNIGTFYSSNPGHPNYREAYLTETGRQQVLDSVKKAATEIKLKNVLAVVASPLPRTIETARIAMNFLELSPLLLETDQRLIESCAGDREGALYSDFEDEDVWFPEDPESFGGETEEQIFVRMAGCYQELVERFSGQEGVVLVVSHGVPVYMLIEAVLGKGSGFRLPTAGYISLPAKVV